MGVTYSADLRQRVIDDVEAGASARRAAARLGIATTTAIARVRRWREAGERTARRQGNPGGSKLDAHADFLLAIIAADPDAGLAISARLSASRGVSAGVSTIWRFYQARGITASERRARLRAVEAVVPMPARESRREDRTARLPTAGSARSVRGHASDHRRARREDLPPPSKPVAAGPRPAVSPPCPPAPNGPRRDTALHPPDSAVSPFVQDGRSGSMLTCFPRLRRCLLS